MPVWNILKWISTLYVNWWPHNDSVYVLSLVKIKQLIFLPNRFQKFASFKYDSSSISSRCCAWRGMLKKTELPVQSISRSNLMNRLKSQTSHLCDVDQSPIFSRNGHNRFTSLLLNTVCNFREDWLSKWFDFKIVSIAYCYLSLSPLSSSRLNSLHNR